MTELQVGVHGLRTFRVSDDGNLLPVTAVDDSWRGGVCIARCRRNPAHSAPAERCRCGIYTFRNLSILRSQYEPADYLVAVVALEGQTLAGVKGWRSQAGRVVALWVRRGALPDTLLRALATNLPDVPFHAEVDSMLAGYPELSVAEQLPDAALASRPLPIRRRPVRTSLVALFCALVAVGTLLFVLGLSSIGQRRLTAVGAGGSSGVDAALVGAGRVGTFLAANDLVLLWPLLFVGVLLAARQPTGPVAAVVAGTAWSVAAAVSAAVLAAVMTGRGVEFNPFAAWMILVFGWRWLDLLLFSVGTADGMLGYAARSALRAQGAFRRLVWPRSPAAGVAYRPRPDHRVSRYPLMVPVHFQQRPGADR